MAEVNTANGLREWARGDHTLEAAAELLIRAHRGRFAQEGLPWIRMDYDSGQFWINAAAIDEHNGAYSSGERRLLSIVQGLLDYDEHPLLLGDAVAGLDRQDMDLVLAALAHANGSHQHSAIEDGAIRRLDSLYPWPEAGA